MTDIVERLERLATWGGNATHLDYEGAILAAKAEIELLRKRCLGLAAHQCRTPISLENGDFGCVDVMQLESEIDRLRAALRLIVNSLHGASDDAEVMKEVAMKALGLRK